MTPTEIETLARQRYNAVNDTFWSQSEVLSYIYKACMELSRDGFPIERSYTQTSVASQQDYDWPSLAVAIKRVTYDGTKLIPIDFREDDNLTLNDADTTSTGTPAYYFVWNRVISLRPIPAVSTGTIKIWTLNQPDAVSVTGTLEIPTQWHPAIIDAVNAEMAFKDQNFTAANKYRELWQESRNECKKWVRATKRRDGFTYVKDEEALARLMTGSV
jgi:hypothetical protein